MTMISAAGLPAEKRAVTLRHLLTMGSGFQWQESGGVAEYNGWVVSADPVAYLLAGEVVWNTVLLASTFIFLRWIAAGASTWLELSATGPSPRPAYRLGLAVAGGMLAAWLGVLHFLYIAFI